MTGEEAPSLRVHTHSSTKEKGDRAFEKDAQTARNARRDNTRIYEYFQNNTLRKKYLDTDTFKILFEKYLDTDTWTGLEKKTIF